MTSDERGPWLTWIQDVRALLESEVASGRTAFLPVSEEPHSTPVRVDPVPAEAPTTATVAPAVDTLTTIRADLGDCRRCRLCEGRKNLVFGVGPAKAELMVIGEGPGEKEDDVGEPFVGPAGEMLDKMLERVVGLPRSAVYIANVVKCRPPGNRNPAPDEIQTCLPYVRRQIRAVAPKVILVLGSVAARSLLESNEGITRLRGRWTQIDGVPVMPTFHPAYLLRKPEDKRYTFEDLKQLRRKLDAVAGTG